LGWAFADNMEILGGSIQWDVSFVREAYDWEMDIFASFFQVLQSATVSRDRAYRLCCVPSKKGVFKVKSYFSSLVGSEGRCFPWKSVWRTQAPPMADFFAWTGALGKILTGNGRSSLWIDATCAREMENLWITFFTVMWLPLCGILFFYGLVCLGLCLEE
jgi:hypothetical protein